VTDCNIASSPASSGPNSNNIDKPMDSTTKITTCWDAFRQRALGDGMLIESLIREVYSALVPQDGHAIDGGANVGFHTLGLSSRLSLGRVLAVEANASTYQDLQRNTAGCANVRRHFGALQADAAALTVDFHCSSSHPGRSGIQRSWDLIAPGKVQYEPTVTVPATTMDKLVANASWRRLDFIKLDLEGGEFPALRGGERSLRELRPLVVTEHGHLAPQANGFTIEEYYAWLDALGYAAMDPAGQPAGPARPYPFWYLFLVPSERADVLAAHLQAQMSRPLDGA